MVKGWKNPRRAFLKSHADFRVFCLSLNPQLCLTALSSVVCHSGSPTSTTDTSHYQNDADQRQICSTGV